MNGSVARNTATVNTDGPADVFVVLLVGAEHPFYRRSLRALLRTAGDFYGVAWRDGGPGVIVARCDPEMARRLLGSVMDDVEEVADTLDSAK